MGVINLEIYIIRCGWKKVEQKDITPLKINMKPENTPLEKENHLPNHHFQVLCQSSGVYPKWWWLKMVIYYYGRRINKNHQLNTNPSGENWDAILGNLPRCNLGKWWFIQGCRILYWKIVTQTIHVTGAFTYNFTININHSCIEMYHTLNWYVWGAKLQDADFSTRVEEGRLFKSENPKEKPPKTQL